MNLTTPYWYYFAADKIEIARITNAQEHRSYLNARLRNELISRIAVDVPTRINYEETLDYCRLQYALTK